MDKNNDASYAWLQALHEIFFTGNEVVCRGMMTREIPAKTVIIDAQRPINLVEERKLGYRFMLAEAYWILRGDDTVEGIAPYSENISKFSDDGKVFAGAYGPKIVSQLKYVVDALIEDPQTRQSVISIWRPNPAKSKDIPCTVAIAFQLRDNKLSAHVFMRSSDVWLGLPYDLFNFSMLLHLVCGLLNSQRVSDGTAKFDTMVSPGRVYLQAASMHLYEKDLVRAREVLTSDKVYAAYHYQTPTPTAIWRDPILLMDVLRKRRDNVTYKTITDWSNGI